MSSSKSLYVIDSEQPTETARLIEQSKLFTSAMGGLFPDELDLSDVRRVLDLGCGPGQWAGDVAFMYPEWQVVGVDINATMIAYAHALARSQGLPNISFEVMNITRPLAFANASFELINARFIVGFSGQSILAGSARGMSARADSWRHPAALGGRARHLYESRLATVRRLAYSRLSGKVYRRDRLTIGGFTFAVHPPYARVADEATKKSQWHGEGSRSEQEGASG